MSKTSWVFVNNFVFSIDLNAKNMLFYGKFETYTNFLNHGVVNICLDLIGQKAKFFLTLLDKCSSRSQVFIMKLSQVS